MDKFENQCQSCGMPLKEGENSGTEKDGSKSKTYCILCYSQGEFLYPNMTLDEMKVNVDNALKEKGWIKPLRLLSQWQLPTLKRWKNK